MEVRLIVIDGKASKREISLKLPTIIGRSREAELTIGHPMVSRQHCEVYEQKGLLMIRDLGSLNGTVVGGQRVSEAAIPPSGEFTVGPLTFRAIYDYDGDPSAIPVPIIAPPKKDKTGAILREELTDSRWTTDPLGVGRQTIEVSPTSGKSAASPPTIPSGPSTASSKDDDDVDDGLLDDFLGGLQ